ncbi:MAG: TerC family protein [Candidatus Sericytochromatia bacterium]|nr:TerC family protein [Candidatus Sericytochromatia bacterium]
MMALLTSPDAWLSLLTLTVMEIVLGIDNVLFISILCERLPKEQQAKARQLGLGLALGARIGLLFAITWVMSLTQPLLTLFGHTFTGRHFILLGGGLFLLYKATTEIHEKLEGLNDLPGGDKATGKTAFGAILGQILLLDVVFSLDSVITAVGMADEIIIMVVAVVLAVVVMLWAAAPISRLVHTHPTLKILALSFLVLIGVVLIAEGMGQHVSKGYIYFSMAFAVGVELLNMRFRKKQPPVQLHEPASQMEPSEG